MVTKKTDAIDIVNWILMTLVALGCIAPFYYIIVYSLSDPVEAATRGLFLFPVGFTLESYTKLLVRPDIYSAAMVSLARTGVGTVVTVGCTTLLAYLLTQKRLYHRGILLKVVVISMYVMPGLIPRFLMYQKLGLLNNFLVYILPFAIVPFYLLVVKTYMEGIPGSLEESARVDGARPLVIFWRIIIPTAIPAVATITVFAAVMQWNRWFDNFIFANVPSLQTLQLLLFKFLKEAEASLASSDSMDVESSARGPATPEAIRMTITVIVVAPIFFVYPYMQRYFIKGINLGAVKG
jgi:putative aldouronate transport system permease protein